MELTILLSKVFGVYFTVMGIFMLFRRGYFKNIVNLFVEEPVLRFFMGLIMFIGGLFMIISHQDWSNFPAGFISFLGWAVTVKALLYMNLSNSAVRRWLLGMKINSPVGNFLRSLLSLIIGVYLLNFSFGFF